MTPEEMIDAAYKRYADTVLLAQEQMDSELGHAIMHISNDWECGMATLDAYTKFASVVRKASEALVKESPTIEPDTCNREWLIHPLAKLTYCPKCKNRIHQDNHCGNISCENYIEKCPAHKIAQTEDS